MNEDHITTFVSECKESITDLNNALLSLEEDPDDDDAVESIFRTAHTLKGNFGAMGFEDASELAHALEDLLDGIRTGRVDVTPDVMDAAFAGVDRIETLVDDVAAAGDTQTATEDAIDRLRSAVEAEGDSQTGGVTGADAPSPPEFDTDSHEVVAHGVVEVDPDGMAGVDGMLVMEALTEAFDQFETEPSRAAIEDGTHDGRFDVFVPEVDADRLAETLETIGAVETFDVTALEGGLETRPMGDITGDGDATDTTGESSGPDESARPTPSASGADISSVRVDVDRLDELHGLVEQLVTGRITIRRAIEAGDLEVAEATLGDFDKATSRLQNAVMDMRLIPLRRVVSNLPRVVRDVARQRDRDVDFEMFGQDVELDRSILTEIEDPLIHVLRNAVDHGIEPPAEREAAGKSREGRIELQVSRQRDHVIVEISDDGRGIDPDAIRARAVEEGVLSEADAESCSDDDAYDLVFHPGLSTASEVTDVSGRGVGMDVVSSTVEGLDGTVDVDSELGSGTTVTLRLPVSVAIVDVLFVRVDDREYGIPLKNIDELTYASDIETADGDEIARHGDDIYPVVRLEDALQVDDAHSTVTTDGGTSLVATADGVSTTTDAAVGGGDDGMLVRIRRSVRPVALRCDAVTDQEEVVVKPLEGPLGGIPGLSGTAILGDGNIVPILDVVSLEP